jgi:hypothetical protein
MIFFPAYSSPEDDMALLLLINLRIDLFGTIAPWAVMQFRKFRWIRMLRIALRASTHAVELMNKSFILGLALGGPASLGGTEGDRTPNDKTARGGKRRG